MEKIINIKVKNSYFVIAENILFDKYANEIGADACFLYLFFKRIGAADKTISVSYSYITKKLRWKNEKISKLIKSLISVNLVEKHKTSKANVYVINDLMPENVKYYAEMYAKKVEKEAITGVKVIEDGTDETEKKEKKYDYNEGDLPPEWLEYNEEDLPEWLRTPVVEGREDKEKKEQISKIEPALFENRTMGCSKIEHKDRYNKDIDILTKVSGKPQELILKIINQLADIPYVWRGVAIEYIARLKKTLTERDLEAIKKLNKLHKPAVVYTQLRRLWNRLKYQPNGLDKLNFSYIYGSMKNYTTLNKTKKEEKKNATGIRKSRTSEIKEERGITKEEQREWDALIRGESSGFPDSAKYIM